MKDEDWEQVLNVNLTSTFRLARAAVKLMMRKRFGRIIGITSVVGVTGNPGQANYTATKAGMIGMFKSIGKEYAKRGVTANCVAPGFIASPMTDKLNDKQREAILQMVPAGKLGGGADVAAAVVYLASDAAQGALITTNWMYPAKTPRAGLPAGFETLIQPATSLLFAPAEAESLRPAAIAEWQAALSN